MSGGSYDYACFRLNDFIEELEKNTNNDPLRIAFCEHMRKVSDAMHDIEWVDSGDYSGGDEHKAIKACLSPTGLDESVKATLRDYANSLLNIVGKDEEIVALPKGVERAWDDPGWSGSAGSAGEQKALTRKCPECGVAPGEKCISVRQCLAHMKRLVVITEEVSRCSECPKGSPSDGCKVCFGTGLICEKM